MEGARSHGTRGRSGEREEEEEGGEGAYWEGGAGMQGPARAAGRQRVQGRGDGEVRAAMCARGFRKRWGGTKS